MAFKEDLYNLRYMETFKNKVGENLKVIAFSPELFFSNSQFIKTMQI